MSKFVKKDLFEKKDIKKEPSIAKNNITTNNKEKTKKLSFNISLSNYDKLKKLKKDYLNKKDIDVNYTQLINEIIEKS